MQVLEVTVSLTWLFLKVQLISSCFRVFPVSSGTDSGFSEGQQNCLNNKKKEHNPTFRGVCVNEQHRLTHAITLASPRPCGVTAAIPAQGSGISRPLRGDAGGRALPLDVTVAVWRWLPALSRAGRGAAHPLGNPRGKRTFLMPEVALLGF